MSVMSYAMVQWGGGGGLETEPRDVTKLFINLFNSNSVYTSLSNRFYYSSVYAELSVSLACSILWI